MTTLKSFAALFILSSSFLSQAYSAVTVKTVEYKDQDITLEGMVAFDPSMKGKHPGILVVHEWDGPGAYVKMRIQKLAELGYVAFAADVYGKGVRPTTMKDMGDAATLYKSNRPLFRKRMKLALDELKKQAHVDTDKLAVMGYCFGGTAALELGRSGADLKGIVSFHGGLDSPTPLDAKNIKGEVLAFHGADDPYVPAKEVDAFEKEMRDAKVKWELVKFGGAVHKFTNPQAGSDNASGAAYNKDADMKSWEEMKLFFNRIFKS